MDKKVNELLKTIDELQQRIQLLEANHFPDACIIRKSRTGDVIDFQIIRDDDFNTIEEYIKSEMKKGWFPWDFAITGLYYYQTMVKFRKEE